MNEQGAINSVLDGWNRLDQAAATEALLPCNGSVAWAIGMVNTRPFGAPKEVFESSDRVWLGLTPSDWQQAFDSHPRIGEHKPKAPSALSGEAQARSLEWSAGEQSAVEGDTTLQIALAAANKEYEQKFGRIFIVCAAGKSAEEMLAILKMRLLNEAATELKEAAEQQRQITQLRLRKWLDMQ